MSSSNKINQSSIPYNGWSNYETWLGNLWITNDEYNYSILCEALKLDGDIYKKAEWLEQYYHSQLDEVVSKYSLWQDFIGHAFSLINWTEIVENNLD